MLSSVNKSHSMLNMCTDLLIADGWFIDRLTVAAKLHRGGPGDQVQTGGDGANPVKKHSFKLVIFTAEHQDVFLEYHSLKPLCPLCPLLSSAVLCLQDHEVNECLKQLMMSLLRAYRFSPIIPDLGFQVGQTNGHRAPQVI